MTATRKMRPSNGLLLLLRGVWSGPTLSSRLSYCTIECSKSTGVQTSAPLCVKSDDLPLRISSQRRDLGAGAGAGAGAAAGACILVTRIGPRT